MKIPRLSSGPFCWTLEQWATRMAFSDLILGILVAVVMFYLSTIVDDIYATTTDADLKEASEAGKAILIALGVIFCIPAVFGIVLLVGLFKKKAILLLIWCIYAVIGCFLFFILLFTLSILVFLNDNVGLEILVLAIAIILTGHLAYSVLIVHSIYLNLLLKDSKVANETNCAQEI